MPKLKVRVNDRIAKYGGAFYDHIQKVRIGAEPVEVELTPLVMRWLSRGEIVKLEDESKSKKKLEWPEDLRADIIAILERFGYDPDSVREAPDEELLSIEGIGPGKLRQIREAFGEE